MLGSERKAVAIGVGAAVVELSTVVEQLQRAAARQTFRRIGLSGSIPEQVQRAHTSGVHRTLRGVTQLAGYLSGTALEMTASADAAPIGDSPKGAVTVAALDCAFGDSLRASRSALAFRMSVRVAGRDIPTDRESLARAYPQAAPAVVVFLHGLGGTESGWGLSDSYGDRLAADLNVSPVQIRYNSGARICDNGADLHDLLDQLTANWPVTVKSLALVGHSMGGLVIRSACNIATVQRSQWAGLVLNIFYLAAPHHGAPMERVAHAAITAIGSRAGLAPIARLMNRRSAGIKDLRHGTLTEADLAHGDPDRREVGDHAHIPLLENATHHFISSTVLPPEYGAISHALGDLLVQPTSATGSKASGRRHPFEAVNAYHLVGLHHNALMKSPAVYAVMRGILASDADAGNTAKQESARRS